MKMLCAVQLSEHRSKTPEGYLVCQDCIIARTGKQTYLKSELFGYQEGEDAYIDVDRNEKEVFNEKTMASFEGKPLTIEHPSESVSPQNYKELSVGNVHNVHRGVYDGQDVMYADIIVYDSEAIDLIESGEMVELSCGYDCDITDGPNPEQINIRGNHVALCEQGRAGIARIQDSWGARPIIKDSVQRGTLIQEFGGYGKQYKIEKIEGNVLYCEELVTHKTTLFKKDKENIDWAIITKAQVNDTDSKLVLYEAILTTDKPWRQTLLKIEEKVNDAYSDIHSKFYRAHSYDFDNVGESNPRKLRIFYGRDEKEFVEYIKKLITNSDKKSDENISYDIIKNIESVGDSEEKITLEECSDCFGLTLEQLNHIWKKINEDRSTDSLGGNSRRKKKLFVNQKEKKKFMESLPKEAEVMADEFDYVLEDEDGEPNKWLVYWEVYYWDPVIKDSKTRYVIALNGDEKNSTWLDKNDKPTAVLKEARTFTTYEEADAHRKIYCNGTIQKIEDSVKDSKLMKEEIEEVKKLLEGIDHEEPIKYDEELKVIDIFFPNKQELRKAGRKLVSLYDIELTEEEDEYSITLYYKFDKPAGISLTEDAETKWGGYNIRKGKPAQDFKQYLRDRGRYFEPSENGDFVHFEVKNPDEDVIKEIRAINEHYKKVGLYDEYDRKFYSKAIKMLNEKLEKLEKNELLDSNQEDYEKQKNTLKKEIKKQIEEYTEKLNGLD